MINIFNVNRTAKILLAALIGVGLVNIFAVPKNVFASSTTYIFEGVETGGVVSLSATDQAYMSSVMGSHYNSAYYWVGTKATQPATYADAYAFTNDWTWTGGYSGSFSSGSVSINLSDIPSSHGYEGNDLYMCQEAVNDAWFDLAAHDVPVGCFHFEWDGSSYHLAAVAPTDGPTSIDTVGPANNDVVASTTPVSISSAGNVNSSDFDYGSTYVKISVSRYAPATLGTFSNFVVNDVFPILNGIVPGAQQIANSFFIGSFNVSYEYEVPEYGAYSYSTTTEQNLDVGTYVMRQTIENKPSGLFSVFKSNTILFSTSTKFIVDHKTKADEIADQAVAAFGGMSSTASSTDWSDCNVLVGFNPAGCLATLFFPTPDEYKQVGQSLMNNVATHFPFGYVTSMVQVLATSSTTTIPVINATLPNGVIGAGANITIDVNHSLDWFLNATTSQFVNSSAPATSTLYEITAPYWEKFVYLCLAFYVLSRIFGSHVFGLFGQGFSHGGAVADSGSSDDSYKLKEYLYKHRLERNYEDRYNR